MQYNNKNYTTFGEIFNQALEFAKNKQMAKAQEFKEAYVNYILEDAPDVNTKEEAEQRMINNFGYYAGYYGDDVRKLMNKYYAAVHPVFGNYYDVTPEEAYDCGLNNKTLERS